MVSNTVSDKGFQNFVMSFFVWKREGSSTALLLGRLKCEKPIEEKYLGIESDSLELSTFFLWLSTQSF